MSPPLRLCLPYPPAVNHHYQRNRSGGVRLSDEARAYRQEVWACVQEQVPVERRVLSGELELFAWLRVPDRRRRDVDGPIKELLDSLAPALGFDDSQIRTLYVRRHGVGDAGVEVVIVEVPA